jgi:O-antigen ligase
MPFLSTKRKKTLEETGVGRNHMLSAFKWLIFLFFATILVFDRAVYNLIALLIVSLAFISIYIYRPRWDKEIQILSLVLLLNLLLALPNLLLARDGLLSLENPVRMLLMIPLILTAQRLGIAARFICMGLAIGVLVASIMISWQYYIEGMTRPGGHYNPILFSEIAMSAFAILLAAFLVFQDRMCKLYLVALLASLYCVVLSGSRGPMLAILPIIVFLVWWMWRSDSGKAIWSSHRTILFPSILLFLGLIVIGTGEFVDRTRLAISETSDYFEKGDVNTAVGLRLELWWGTLLAAREHPVLGIGHRDRNVFIKEKIKNGELQPDVKEMRHAHSDYLGALQTRGIPGLVLQVLIYLVPLLIFLRALGVARGEQLFAALAGTLTSIVYMTYSLTEVPMHNGLPLIFYIVTTSLFVGLVNPSQNITSSDHSS